MLDQGYNFQGRFYVKSVIGVNNLHGVGVHPVDGDMDVIIVSVVVQPVNNLMASQSHAFKKNVHQLVNLRRCRLLVFPPAKYPMRYRQFAVNRFRSKGNHLHSLTGMCCRNKIPVAGMFDFFFGVNIMRMPDIIHQVGNLPLSGFMILFTSNLLRDHRELLQARRFFGLSNAEDFPAPPTAPDYLPLAAGFQNCV